MGKVKFLDVLLGKIVDEKTHQALQKELEGQLHALHEGAIVSETDIRGNITFANDTFCEISGYSREELLGKNHRILKSGKQPDEIFKDLWATISSGKVWKGIICNKKKNGDFYWVKSTIVPVMNDDGVPIKYVAVRFDITEQVQMQMELQQKMEEIQSQEEELRQLNEELHSTIEELTSTNDLIHQTQKELEIQIKALNEAAIVSATDIRGNIIYVNDAFCRISKYSREELMGKNHRIVRHPDMPAAAFEEMWKTISSSKVWRGIIKNKAKDGSAYWVHAMIMPVLDSKGIPERYISVRFDITAEKELEELLHQKDQTVEKLNTSLAMAQKALEKKLDSVEMEFKQSLNYAQRIQKAIMPSVEEVQKCLPNGYKLDILFQPKEAVSGDFYWATQVHNRTLIFVGDATGHGVAGSFISLLAMNALNNLVKQKLVLLPDILLQELHNELSQTLRQNENSERTILDSLEGYAVLIEGDKISIASAMRPIWLVSANGEIQEIHGTKKSIAGKDYYGDEQFISHSFILQPNDTLYLCSDGIETQLGGHAGNQKFGKQGLKELLQHINGYQDLSKRSKAVLNRFHEWKGFFAEQNDDIVLLILKKQ